MFLLGAAVGTASYHYERFAGTAGYAGSDNGTIASRAKLGAIRGLAADAQGNVYLADGTVIRKATLGGVVTTLVGQRWITGHTDGGPDIASLALLGALVLGADGNIYVAETHAIRKVDLEGNVSTVAEGTVRDADGEQLSAAFSTPAGIAVNAEGVMYVVDPSTPVVSAVHPDGRITILAGNPNVQGFADGASGAASFNWPSGVAIDGSGNVYVADRNNHAIRKISPAGAVTTLAGSGSSGDVDGVGTAARFNQPTALAFDPAGNLYVSDAGNAKIRKITPSGVVTTAVGVSRDSPVGNVPRLHRPGAIAFAPDGTLYIAEPDLALVRRYTTSGELTRFVGVELESAAFGYEDGTDAGALFHRITGMVRDPQGHLIVADAADHTLRKVTPAGIVATLAGSSGSPGSADGIGTTARFDLPSALALDSSGNIFVADTKNHVVRRVTPAGVVTTFAGQAGISGSADGRAAARFYLPNSIAIDSAGNLYVGDGAGGRLRKISPDGNTTTVAGNGVTLGHKDGLGTAAVFGGIDSIVVQPSGDLLVADSLSNTVRKVTPAGQVSTFAGIPFSTGPGLDGPIASARFQMVSSLMLDHEGNLLVGETSQAYPFQIIRRIAAGNVTTLSGPGDDELARPAALVLDPSGGFWVAGDTTISRAWPNRPPVLPAAAATTYTASWVDVVLRGSDPDGDRVSYTIQTASHATARIDGRTLTITPYPGFNGSGSVTVIATDGFATSAPQTITFTVVKSGPAILQPPANTVVSYRGMLTLSMTATPPASGPPVTYQWYHNGMKLTGYVDPVYQRPYMGPDAAGLYHAAASSRGRTFSEPAIVGMAWDRKALGGSEVGPNILHPNGNTYDQILLDYSQGYAATATADAGQVLRISFVDLQDDIVQVEYSGPGNLSLTPIANSSSGPALPEKYNQDVRYVRGLYGIVLTGATADTHLSVFSVGRLNAHNQGLFRSDISYDGFADIAFIAISSTDGKFGGLRAANANFWADRGHAGLYAPGVQFTGPVYLHDITTFDAATPVLVIGSSVLEPRITGGDLAQPNERPVQVRGLSTLRFSAGSSSHGVIQPAQRIAGRLEQDGVDVTEQIAVGP